MSSPVPSGGGDVTRYVGKITSEHIIQPNFTAMVGQITQAWADNVVINDAMCQDVFDLDEAVGAQLDAVALWIGVTRYVTVPLSSGIAFTFDLALQGWDQGIWDGGASGSVVVRLGDYLFRLLLYARAVANEWDGTIPDAYEAWETMFAPLGYTIKIYDQGNMTMHLELDGPPPSNLLIAIFKGGYLDLRPAGVAITQYLVNGVPV
jgi:hypothetical protein